ncbi:hypothetical protein HBN50_10255 [Halobacteriovorax sp. GB3]|uniref:hypothetical protein n=1 Tax=Halobacteriovorax sp. GB3 TaxID=2719615 RepID=UPI002360D8FC|nr:hypothetical protein [Halobacteriovorax sp. GB3]MDD0853483.1 hypothetical protein [Halobacteriovorax sp. GB3]
MKVVISCDDVLARDHVTEIIESILGLYDEAEIYTLAHKPKGILGPVELRKIHSTFLSHKVKSKKGLGELSYLIPSAAKNLFIPCSVDLIINISSGLSQGIKKCEKTKQITYLYDNRYERKKKTFKEKFFSGFVKSFFKKSFKNADILWVSNSSLKQELAQIGYESEVVEPPFKINDWQIIPSPLFTYDHFAVNAKGLDLDMAKKIRSLFKEKGIKFKFFGIDGHLNEMKEGPEDKDFFGDRCSGELAPLLSGARAIIDLEDCSFPVASLKGLGTGRPVVSLDTPSNKAFLTGLGITHCAYDFDALKECIEEVLKSSIQVESKKLRAHALNYNEIKFKAFFKRRIDKLFQIEEKRSDIEKDSCC